MELSYSVTYFALAALARSAIIRPVPGSVPRLLRNNRICGSGLPFVAPSHANMSFCTFVSHGQSVFAICYHYKGPSRLTGVLRSAPTHDFAGLQFLATPAPS